MKSKKLPKIPLRKGDGAKESRTLRFIEPKRSHRKERLASEIQREVSKIWNQALENPMLKKCQLYSVEVAPRMVSARLTFVHTLDHASEALKLHHALKGAVGWLRSLLTKRLVLRRVPELVMALTRPSLQIELSNQGGHFTLPSLEREHWADDPKQP